VDEVPSIIMADGMMPKAKRRAKSSSLLDPPIVDQCHDEVQSSAVKCHIPSHTACTAPKSDNASTASPREYVQHMCPVCGVMLPSFREASTHCANLSVRYCCPLCNVRLRSREEALSHCIQQGEQVEPVASNDAIGIAVPDALGIEGAAMATPETSARYECPLCGEDLPSHQEALLHCMRPSAKYRCPHCGELLSTREDAVSHCSSPNIDLPVTAGPPSKAVPATCVASAIHLLPAGELVAVDAEGRPLIVRHTDPETGQVRTCVQNEDGTLCAFGDKAVLSMLQATEADTEVFINSLTHRQMHALTHEIGRRLVEMSRLYQAQKSKLEQMLGDVDNEYFGIFTDATEKDLDNAYRRLARTLHPDKNGGTEAAKQQFQAMKERYERLKAKHKGGTSENTMSQNGGQPTQGAERIEYDPGNRNSLDDTVWKMLRQLRSLDEGMSGVTVQLARMQTPPPVFLT